MVLEPLQLNLLGCLGTIQMSPIFEPSSGHTMWGADDLVVLALLRGAPAAVAATMTGQRGGRGAHLYFQISTL